ncbi:MAG: alpha/beta hydrolase [Fluviicola sp.]
MEQKLNSSKTFRFEISSESKEFDVVLYVLHGYGQQAQYFIRKFRPFFDRMLVVAPEGMHRFYLEGSSGRVGASWMTKEAREDDISDNIEWLNALDARISNQFQTKRKLLLGFSQGGATAARWFHKGNVQFDAMILWACVFPPDLSPEEEISQATNQFFVIGDNDEFYNRDAQEELVKFYLKKGFATHRFQGKHDIHAATLEQILHEINESVSNL